MQTDERQVAPTRAAIRRDHVARYEWAAKVLPAGSVVDVACGIGYGAQLLAEAGHRVVAVDRDQGALDYGAVHYAHPQLRFLCADANALELEGPFDAAVSFETIEHLADPLPLLKALHKAAPVLLASVPNEVCYPHRGVVKHHFRHYTPAEFRELLEEAGWEVKSWHGQAGRESEVEPERMGRTMVVVAERAPEGGARQVPFATLKVAPELRVPDHVAIVGLGPSCAQFFELVRRLGGASAYCDEVWGLNAIGDVLRCDRVFHMDDVRIQELRAAERPDGPIAAMLKWLRRHPGPVYTSIPREGYPGMAAYPLQDVLNGRYDTNGGAPYFNSTGAYAIAYAVHLGVKKISLYGLDYTLPNRYRAEKGRACCEFWLGIAAARGIEIQLPEETSLLDACESEAMRLYGYDCVEVTLRDRIHGGVEVLLKDRAEIPTAAEIEARYDHSKHPNPIVARETKEA